MMIRGSRGKMPEISHSARAAENAAVIGDVTLGAFVTLWYGAVLRGDEAPIRIGDGSNIQDNCTVHCAIGKPVTVGTNVVVGHGAILHSCTVEDGCLIGMGATLLNGCRIGAESIVGAGALVAENKVIPPRSLVLGIPGRVVRTITDEEAAAIRENARHYAEDWLPELEEIPVP